MDNSTMIKVTNRSCGSFGYDLPELNIHRHFTKGETKTIPFSELYALSNIEGGSYALNNSLIIEQAALDALFMKVEPEYHFTEADVKDLLFNGSIEQLEDALNFAPKGVIELIKDIAVKEQVPDTRKRKLISQKTGFNIDSSINIAEQMAGEEEAAKEEQAPVRKATTTTATAPARKAPTAYKSAKTVPAK